jgi:hypothetical protein
LKRAVRVMIRSMQESFASIGWDRMSSRLGISLLVVSALFFAANFADKAWVSYQVGQEKQQRLADIAIASAQISSLKQDLSYLHSKTYYMQVARRYGYVQPGDIQLELNQIPAPPSTAGDRPAQPAAKQAKQHESLLHRLLQAVVPGL